MDENASAEGKSVDVKFRRNLWRFTKFGFFFCEQDVRSTAVFEVPEAKPNGIQKISKKFLSTIIVVGVLRIIKWAQGDFQILRDL